MFEKRHYVAVASVLKSLPSKEMERSIAYDQNECECNCRVGHVDISDIIDEARNAFADMFATDNPRFDRIEFLVAAGLIGTICASVL